VSDISDDLIWSTEMDTWIDLDAINASNEREWREEQRIIKFDDLGAIELLAAKRLSSSSLIASKLQPDDWDWALHESRKAFDGIGEEETEKHLLTSLLAIGKPYGIARYARWERLSHPSALAASLPLGLNALLNQYLLGQGLHTADERSTMVRDHLYQANLDRGEIAYLRTRHIQQLIHSLQLSQSAKGRKVVLDREATRSMLSLTRLHFSVSELRFGSIIEWATISAKYDEARRLAASGALAAPTRGRVIPNWSLRHLRSLVDFFPVATRSSFDRAKTHAALGRGVSRDIAINELALAKCGILLMRRSRYCRGH
jgi:hypothetical protein